jgi:hypothetical protein
VVAASVLFGAQRLMERNTDGAQDYWNRSVRFDVDCHVPESFALREGHVSFRVPHRTKYCISMFVRQGSGVPRIFFRGGGVQQIQLRTEGRENGDRSPLVRGSIQIANE